MSTVQTPEITINNNAAEIKAAMESQGQTPPAAPPSQPEVTPAAPATPPAEEQLPYTFSETPDGVEIRLETGAVYKGKNWQEAALAAAKGKAEADKTLYQFRQQSQSQPHPEQQPEPIQDIPFQQQQGQISPDDQAYLDYHESVLARAQGKTLQQYRVEREVENQEKQVNTFLALCPDYPNTPEAHKVMQAYFPENFPRFPTAQELKMVFAQAVYEGKLTPVRNTAIPQVARPTPPPVMPTAGSGMSMSEPDPYKMPLSELKKLAFQQ